MSRQNSVQGSKVMWEEDACMMSLMSLGFKHKHEWVYVREESKKGVNGGKLNKSTKSWNKEDQIHRLTCVWWVYVVPLIWTSGQQWSLWGGRGGRGWCDWGSGRWTQGWCLRLYAWPGRWVWWWSQTPREGPCWTCLSWDNEEMSRKIAFNHHTHASVAIRKNALQGKFMWSAFTWILLICRIKFIFNLYIS